MHISYFYKNCLVKTKKPIKEAKNFNKNKYFYNLFASVGQLLGKSWGQSGESG